jgi:hypothetical protein
MLTVEIARAGTLCWPTEDIESLIGRDRLYLKGTNPEMYVNFRDRATADLAVVNLNLIPGIRARICGE